MKPVKHHPLLAQLVERRFHPREADQLSFSTAISIAFNAGGHGFDSHREDLLR